MTAFSVDLLGRFQRPFGDLDPRSVGLALASLVAASFWCASAASRDSRHFLGTPQGRGVLPLQVGEPCVFLLRQDQIGLGGVQPCLGLLDPMLDLVLGQLQGLLGSGLVRLGSREATAGDLDLNGDLHAEPGEGGLLPPQLRLGPLDLAAGQLHLIAVRHRVDLRQHLALLDPVVLLDKEADEMPRHGLRRDVDDVGLHKGIVGDRVSQAVGPPQVDKGDR